MKKALLPATLALVAMLMLDSVSARAEQLMNLPPEMKLLHGVPDQGEIGNDATVALADPTTLPDGMQEELKAQLLMRHIAPERIGDLSVYAWSSPWIVQNNSYPNFIIDFVKFAGDKKDAAVGNDPNAALCNDEGCLLVGYIFQPSKDGSPGIWTQDFQTRSLKTTFEREQTVTPHYALHIRTLLNSSDCRGGLRSNGGCLRQFDWRHFGLAITPISH